MRIAVSYDNGLVAKKFGKTEQFKIYDAHKGSLLKEMFLETGGVMGTELAQLLGNNDVNVLLCGGIGAEAKTALAKECIVFFPGVVGKADYQVEDFLKGKLSFNSILSCSDYGVDEDWIVF